MSPITPEDLNAELGRWEYRTRGYQVWDYHVELQPAYAPLFANLATQRGTVVDDGRRPGFWQRVRGISPELAPSSLPAAEPKPGPFRAASLCELQLVVPAGFLVRASLASEFAASLHNVRHPIAFELVGVSDGVFVQLCCAQVDKPAVLTSLRAFFPEVQLREHTDVLVSQWFRDTRYGQLIDFGLSEYSIRQLRRGPHLDADPLIGLVGALNDLERDELGLVQVLFAPARQNWGYDLDNFASQVDELSRIVPMIRAKFNEPILAAVIRVAALANLPDVALARARAIGNALIAATRSELNSLLPLDNEGYPEELHAQDILRRETHRSGMLLNISELLTLVHLPSALVRADRMLRQSERTKPAPALCRGGSLTLGVNEHNGEECSVGLNVQQRLRHTYIIGSSGTGKSTLMLHAILQDLEQGNGFAVLDPHGDLVDDIIARLPADRIGDVALFDPSDEEYPFGFNILSAHSDLERNLLSSDLVGIFRRLSTSFGDQMVSVLGNATLAFLESKKGGTLLDLRRFLVDPAFRARHLNTVEDSEVVYFWQHEFPLLKGVPQAPLLTRLDTFLRPKLLRYMVAQNRDRLDLRTMMDTGKILLAKLSHGAIGEENAHLLGSLLVARINQAAMSRQEQDREQRRPFFLYIDEFHNFVTPSIATILSGARKYGLGLTVAHQDLRQVKSRSEDVASAVLANAYTRIAFRVGDSDARVLADGFSSFESQDLQNLGVGEAIARVEQAAYDFNLKTLPLEQPDSEGAAARRQQVIAHSRSAFSTAKEAVEQVLKAANEEAKAEPKAAPFKAPPAPSSNAPEAPANQPPPAPTATDSGRPASTPFLPTPGRGGPQHKYLQSLIKRAAEDRGFRATIERSVLDGHGHIDVALERDQLSVGCEISVTTSMDHEVDNLSKCLAAGFDYAVMISSDKRLLATAERVFAPTLTEAQHDKVRFLTPDLFIGFLDQLVADGRESTQTVRGYKVNVKYRAISEEERQEKERVLADVISKSLRRQKKSS